jgi:hypothetical protein
MASHGVPKDQHTNRRDSREHQASDIKAGNGRPADHAVQPAASQSAGAGERDAHVWIIAPQIEQFAGDKPSDQTKRNPTNSSKQHVKLPKR